MRTRGIFFITAMFFALIHCSSGPVSADGEKGIELSAETDKTKINIGDHIELGIKTDGKKAELLFPETPEKMGEFSVIETRPLEKGWPRANKIGQAYVLSIYTTGTHVIPPVKVRYREKPGEDWREAQSPQVPVEVESVLTGDEKDIRDLKGLAAFGVDPVPIVSAIAAILFVAAVIWFLRKKRKQYLDKKLNLQKLPHEIAYEQLRELKEMDLPGKGRVKEYYIRLSDIVRHYLEGRFSYRAPEMTTEEFLNAVKESLELKDEHKGLLREFLSHCDMVKFAKYGPTQIEILDSYGSAEKLIDQTKEERPQTNKEEVED